MQNGLYFLKYAFPYFSGCRFGLKAIGGVRVKKMMLGWYERALQNWNTRFYRMRISRSVFKLSQFEVRNFSRILHKLVNINAILRYFTQNVSSSSIFDQIGWNFHQMSKISRQIKLRSVFCEIWKLTILC